MTTRDEEHRISVDQLRVGLYIHLGLGWMDHPFTFGNFKIKDEEQIATIKQLGLKTLRYDPLRSDCEPTAPIAVGKSAVAETAKTAPLADQPTAATATADAGGEELTPEQTASLPSIDTDQPEIDAGSQYAGRLEKLTETIRVCEKEFEASADAVRDITRNLATQPLACRHQAEELVGKMVESMLTEGDVVIHAINGNTSKDENYVHSLNVTVLAMMLAKSMDISADDVKELGLAAIFHDIGKSEVPGKVLMKTDPLTKPEQALYEQHCEFGARIALKSGLSTRVATVIMQHHEHADGSGYPKSLAQAQTDPLARLLAIVNAYDNLCNPVNPMSAMTPYEALAHMFATLGKRFDKDILKLLIKSLGIYPPGSVVQLSNNIHGIVVSVNPNKPLRPFVMLHEPSMPRETALVLNMSEEPTLNIVKCLRPGQLPKDVFDYLNPRKRISYYFRKDEHVDGQ
jgi:putative nucleotidyltransferase with HDIG domain